MFLAFHQFTFQFQSQYHQFMSCRIEGHYDSWWNNNCLAYNKHSVSTDSDGVTVTITHSCAFSIVKLTSVPTIFGVSICTLIIFYLSYLFFETVFLSY